MSNARVKALFHDNIEYDRAVEFKPIKSQEKQVVKMDYLNELKTLEENESQGSGDYWKPEAGQHRVKALGELEEGKPYEEEGKDPQLRKQIKLLVESKEVLWSMPHGVTPASTYGQLVKLGAAKGKLTDSEFTVVVTGTGKSKRYTIVI